MKPVEKLKKLFTSPIFLLILVSVCTYAYFKSKEKSQKIANGFSAIACADSSQKVISTLRYIIKEEDPEKYLLLVKKSIDRIEFPARLIPNNTSVTVIDTLESHPEIVQIYIHREYSTSVNPRNEYLWIWEGYICR
jgi:hypothetical protein